MTIAVIGATGRVGRLVVEHLRADGEPVRVLVRDPDKVTGCSPAWPRSLAEAARTA